jgi:hypothetical protein
MSDSEFPQMLRVPAGEKPRIEAYLDMLLHEVRKRKEPDTEMTTEDVKQANIETGKRMHFIENGEESPVSTEAVEGGSSGTATAN